MLPEIERVPLVIVPGANNSGPNHWQTFWEAAHPDWRRTEPASFDVFDLEDWVRALEAAIARCATSPALAAHKRRLLGDPRVGRS
jgi:predicted alpha/beta hydrolase family esterase